MKSVNLRKRYVIFFHCVRRWQHHIPRSVGLSGRGKEFFNLIRDLNANLDHHQNLTTFKLGQV